MNLVSECLCSDKNISRTFQLSFAKYFIGRNFRGKKFSRFSRFSRFSLNSELREKLIATGDKELIEGNHWNDRFWGVCRGKGQNHLGKLLMELREILKKSS